MVINIFFLMKSANSHTWNVSPFKRKLLLWCAANPISPQAKMDILSTFFNAAINTSSLFIFWSVLPHGKLVCVLILWCFYREKHRLLWIFMCSFLHSVSPGKFTCVLEKKFSPEKKNRKKARWLLLDYIPQREKRLNTVPYFTVLGQIISIYRYTKTVYRNIQDRVQAFFMQCTILSEKEI